MVADLSEPWQELCIAFHRQESRIVEMVEETWGWIIGLLGEFREDRIICLYFRIDGRVLSLSFCLRPLPLSSCPINGS